MPKKGIPALEVHRLLEDLLERRRQLDAELQIVRAQEKAYRQVLACTLNGAPTTPRHNSFTSKVVRLVNEHAGIGREELLSKLGMENVGRQKRRSCLTAIGNLVRDGRIKMTDDYRLFPTEPATEEQSS